MQKKRNKKKLSKPTNLSYFWSNISLITHPPARIKNDPAPKRASAERLGRQPAGAAKPMDQAHGQNSNHVPQKNAYKKQSLTSEKRYIIPQTSKDLEAEWSTLIQAGTPSPSLPPDFGMY